MKNVIVYTQRVENIIAYGEKRDCADQRIPDLLSICGYVPVPVYNRPKEIEKFMQTILPVGVLFTGGNSLCKYGGDAVERDEAEKILLKWCLQRKIPVLGICRGMQLIADYFGAKLEPVEHHTAVRHEIKGVVYRDSVNSFHTQGIKSVPDTFDVLSISKDGIIEAIRHKKEYVTAIMWHPERENPFKSDDIDFIKKCFNGVK